MPKPSNRVILDNLTCTRVSSYERDLFGGDLVKLVWRYAFVDVHGTRYVYSGQKLALVATDVVLSLVATIKCAKDSYGFCRLSRPKVRSVGAVFYLI